MTLTTDERLDLLIAQLERMGVPLDLGVEALATGALPPNVTAGQLITSAWGNAVADELLRNRGETWAVFNHSGSTVTGPTTGQFDNGQTVLGPFAYPVTVTVIATHAFGFNGSGGVAAGGVIQRLANATQRAQPGSQLAASGNWAFTPNSFVYAVAVGEAAGFKTITSVTFNQTGGVAWYQANGVYHIQRTGAT